MGGIQSKFPSPTKPSLQKHLLVFPSQAALRPQENESQRSRHFPEMQERGSGQGMAGEQVSGTQLPPGKGFPKVPWEQAQVGPVLEMMHWALRPQITPSHIEVHFPSAFSLYPIWQRHQAACFSGMHRAFSPQGSDEQGLMQVDAWQSS